MDSAKPATNRESSTLGMFDMVIRLSLAFLLASWCFYIIEPFIVPVLWAVIIAVAIHPLYKKLCQKLGGRKKTAATLFTLIALLLLITPTVMTSSSLIDSTQKLSANFENGTITIPPPNKSVKEWPLVGEKLHTLWSKAASNLEGTLKTYQQEIKSVGETILSAVAGIGAGVLQFILSIIIAGILLASSSNAYQFSLKVFKRLTGEEQGQKFTDLAGATIRSVAQGVLGVAFIQATMAAIGMYFIGVPGWGIWTVIILITAIAQLPPIIVLAPIIAYVYSVTDTTPATIFAIWSVIVSMSDGFLKPIFLGRGMETPMLIILLGAIGGMMLSGIIGLFVGAIILALGYELFMAWLTPEKELSSQES